MTNQTNLDYLFKLTALLPERSAGGPASTVNRRPPFDDHLVQASAASLSSSSSFGGSPTRSNQSPSGESAGRVNDASSDDRDSATSGKPAEETVTDPSATEDAIAPVDEHDDAAQQAVSGSNETSADDVTGSNDENDSPQEGAEELAAAAFIANGQAAQVPDEQATLDGAAVNTSAGETQQPATSTEFDDPAERRAGDASAVEFTESQRESGASTTSLDVDGNIDHQVSLEPLATQSAVDQASKSNTFAGSAAEDKAQNESTARKHSNASSTAVESFSAAVKPAAGRAESKSENAADSSRESVGESQKQREPRRTAGSRSTSPTDGGAAHAQAAPITPTSPAGAAIANSAATGEAASDASRVAKSVGHSANGQHLTTRSQRAAVAAGRRAQGSTPDLPRVDAARFVGRVAKAVQTAQERGGALQLRLSPPELGSLRLELTMQNGVMTAAAETETTAARQVLLDHLPALRERLAEQNIRIERFDVDVRQENSGGQADPRASQQDDRQRQPQQPNSRHAIGRPAAPESTTNQAPPRAHLTNSELNLLA